MDEEKVKLATMNNDEMKSSNNCLGLGDLRKHVRMSGEMNNCLGFGSLGEGRTQSQVKDGGSMS